MGIENNDYIIVGSGPGGATVAKELSQRKQKVLILEWGDNDPLTGSFWWGTRSLLWPGRSLLFTQQMLGLVRGITAGGSSVFYYATSFPVPFDMLKSHGINITAEVQEARKELPIAPLKDEMMGPMASRIMESALDLGYKWQKLDKFMYQDRWRPEYPFGQMFSRRRTLQIMVKAKDELGGHITDGGGVRKILDNSEKRKLLRGCGLAKEILQKAGARSIFRTGYLAAHPGGTVKVGDLLDSDLKTEYDNLYVCDCSVIPEAWGLPPTRIGHTTSACSSYGDARSRLDLTLPILKWQTKIDWSRCIPNRDILSRNTNKIFAQQKRVE